MRLPTASALERSFECPPSLFLPVQACDSSVYAERGTVIARFIRNVTGGMSREAAAALVLNDEWRATCLALNLSCLIGDLSDVRGEMAYAYNYATAEVRELGSNIGRKYPPIGVTEYAGTNDLEGVRFDGVPVAIDVKTGQPVTPACDNAQVKFHALCRMIATGADECEGRIAYVHEDGEVTLDCHTFTRFELECFADELCDLAVRIAGEREAYQATGRVSVSAGEHCRYCPSKVSCPQYVALAREMVRVTTGDLAQPDIRERLAAMSPEALGAIWDKARQCEDVLENVLKGIRAIARESPVPLPGDKQLEQRTRLMPRFQKEKALALINELGATPAQVASLTVKVEEPYVAAFAAPGAPKKRRLTTRRSAAE